MPKELPTSEIVGRDKEGNAVALTKEYRITEKFKKWEECYFDDSNSETYLNATRSALKVYNTTSYSSAATIGSDNLRKLENIGQRIGEKLGITPEQLIKLAMKKAVETDKEAYWDRVAKAVGYYELLNQRDSGKYKGLKVETDKEGNTKVMSMDFIVDDGDQS